MAIKKGILKCDSKKIHTIQQKNTNQKINEVKKQKIKEKDKLMKNV